MEEVTNFFQTLSEARKGELSEQELDMVAGGKYGDVVSVGIEDIFCVVENTTSGRRCRDYL